MHHLPERLAKLIVIKLVNEIGPLLRRACGSSLIWNEIENNQRVDDAVFKNLAVIKRKAEVRIHCLSVL